MSKLSHSFKSFAPLLLMAVLICLPLFAMAQGDPNGTNPPLPNGTNPPLPNGTNPPSGSFSIENPLRGNITNFCDLLELVLRAIVIIGLPVAVLFLIYVGFHFIIAQGKEEKLRDAKRNLLYTIVGIGIFLGAWTIAQIIKSTLQALGVGSFGSC